MYVSVTVVFVLCRCAGRHCSFVVPSELAFSATVEETCISFTFRFIFHVHGRFPEIHLLSVLRDGGPSCPPPPGSWGRAFLLIREANPSLRISLRFPPAGGPSPSLAISSSNQSMSSRPFQPGNINGKVTSNVGQRVALWPVFPHEKHFTSDQLRRTGRSLSSCRGDCCSAKYV